LCGIEVRCADSADLAGLQQLVIGAQCLRIGRLVRPVGEIEVDPVDAEPRQRFIDRLQDPALRQAPLALNAEIRAHLGEDNHLVAHAGAALQPVADDRLGLAALVANRPRGIDVGGIDGIEAMVDKGIENVETGLLINGPSEHIATEHQGRDVQSGFAQWTLIHSLLPR